MLHKMYVSNVGNRLREMQTPSDIDCMRYPLELMQNAKDSISGSGRNSVVVKLEINDNIVIFQHDGCPFNGKTYLALLYNIQKEKQIIWINWKIWYRIFNYTFFIKSCKKEGPIIDEDGTICAFEVTMYRNGKNNEELVSRRNKKNGRRKKILKK